MLLGTTSQPMAWVWGDYGITNSVLYPLHPYMPSYA